MKEITTPVLSIVYLHAVKEKINIKTFHTILPVLGLAFLLLLSPCKIRNFIQAELGIPQTEVANKNKSTISQSNCSELKIDTSTLTKENSSTQYLPAVSANIEAANSTSHFSDNFIQPIGARNHSASVIPFYILYQNFKDYL